MTKEEALKKAEEWVDSQFLKTTGYQILDLAIIRLWMIDAYMQCYADMTSGRPDRWLPRLKNGSLSQGVAFLNKQTPQRLKLIHEDWVDIVPVKLLVLEDK